MKKQKFPIENEINLRKYVRVYKLISCGVNA